MAHRRRGADGTYLILFDHRLVVGTAIKNPQASAMSRCASKYIYIYIRTISYIYIIYLYMHAQIESNPQKDGTVKSQYDGYIRQITIEYLSIAILSFRSLLCTYDITHTYTYIYIYIYTYIHVYIYIYT